MSKHTINWFIRGRDAFTAGKPGFCDDARISGASRQAWYEGWKYQRNLNTTPAAREDLDEAVASIREIILAIKSHP
jgi:hypothetical protein